MPHAGDSLVEDHGSIVLLLDSGMSNRLFERMLDVEAKGEALLLTRLESRAALNPSECGTPEGGLRFAVCGWRRARRVCTRRDSVQRDADRAERTFRSLLQVDQQFVPRRHALVMARRAAVRGHVDPKAQ